MVLRQTWEKPLAEPIINQFSDAYLRHKTLWNTYVVEANRMYTVGNISYRNGSPQYLMSI